MAREETMGRCETKDGAETKGARIFSGRPLPTRMRPNSAKASGEPSTPDEIWARFRKAARTLGAEAGETPPEITSVDDIVEWGLALCLWADLHGPKADEPCGSPLRAAQRSAAGPLVEWLIGRHGALWAVQAASRIRTERPKRGLYYDLGAWSDALSLALRAALTSAPEAGYDEALAWCLADCEGRQDWKREAFYASILADDRPARHALQPLAVLRTAAAQGVEIMDEMEILPLIVDAPSSEVSEQRNRRGGFFRFCYMDIGLDELCATVIAVAKANAEQATPTLHWLRYYGLGAELPQFAAAILETHEEDALAGLLSLLPEKWFLQTLERAADADPEFIFKQCLASASERVEPVMRARIADLLTRCGRETARAWANSLDAKAVKYLEALIGDADALASPEALPLVFRDPPWRRKRGKNVGKTAGDIVLAIQPIATPFACGLVGKKWKPEHPYRLKRPLAVKDMAQFPAFIVKTELEASSQASTPDMSVAESLVWLTQRLTVLSQERRYNSYYMLYDVLERLPEPLALMLWELTGPLLCDNPPLEDVSSGMLLRFGEAALPGLLKLIEANPVLALPLARHVDAPEIAPLAARAMARLKKARPLAMDWLRACRRTAMTRLIPDAVSASGPARDDAERTLRWFVKNDAQAAAELAALVEDYAQTEPRVRDAVEQVLKRDPLDQFPAKITKLPLWLAPNALARPVLHDDGGALPDDALAALAEMVAFSKPDAVYAGIAVAREACTPQSLGAFAWDLLLVWLAAGAPPKEDWALRAVGWLGDDECARRLTALIRKWPGESAHARAVTGLDALADIGSDVALMNLNGVAEKVKFKVLQEKARAKIAAIAEARDLTPVELSDRLAPDLDLDERGGLDLDFGQRRFRAGFDEFLKPWVKDADNVRLKELPKPNKSDDAKLSAAAVARWSALKKDARAVASLQLTRLEAMLVTARRVRLDVFWAFFASHPLIRHLAQRLVWGLYDDDASMTRPSLSFRVGEDLTFSDSSDNPAELDVAADARGVIGLVHPLQMAQDEIEAWGAVFSDYEIMQPFPQLSRETYALTDAEKESASIDRFTGVEVESTRLRGMAARGWPLGCPEDGGCIWRIERYVRLAAGGTAYVCLSFGDGLYPGGCEAETQTLGHIELHRDFRFGDLDPVAASEMLRGLTLLAQTGKP
jgi:hypothetical protein